MSMRNHIMPGIIKSHETSHFQRNMTTLMVLGCNMKLGCNMLCSTPTFFLSIIDGYEKQYDAWHHPKVTQPLICKNINHMMILGCNRKTGVQHILKHTNFFS